MSDTTSEMTLTPRLRSLLERRGVLSEDQIQSFLNCKLDHLLDPFTMKNMRRAVERIEQAVRQNQLLMIHGDYDVDGVTATAILAHLLQSLGGRFKTFLPEREADGYGVSEKAIRKAAQEGVQVLITADCGITAHTQIETANQLGLDVLVLDHHRIPPQGVPKAFAVLNPLQEDCEYSCKLLTAGGLAFKLAQAMLGAKAYELLDLAALSTVCDVAPLQEENRIIVRHGLKALGQKPNQGLKAIMECANLRATHFDTSHLGFVLGPRINASGRMSTPDLSLRILLTENYREAKSLAKVLEEENRERQREERQTTQEAIRLVERTVNFNRERVLVVGKQGWHQGVIGIVASRLVDKFHRPAVVIALDGEEGKGSGRSVKGFNLFEAFQNSSEFLVESGGHELAAGLKIKSSQIDAFRSKINEYALNHLNPDILKKQIKIDLEIIFSDLKQDFIEELKWLEPFGMGNSRPVFLTKRLTVQSVPKIIYGNTKVFLLTSEEGVTFEAQGNFSNLETETALLPGAVIDIAYSVKTKIWNGIETLRLDLKEIRRSGSDEEGQGSD